MGLFDKLKNTAASAVGGAVNNAAMSIGTRAKHLHSQHSPKVLRRCRHCLRQALIRRSRRLHLLYAHCALMRQTKISVRKCSTG